MMNNEWRIKNSKYLLRKRYANKTLLKTTRLYRLSFVWAICLPAIAMFYNLMTIDSAIRHWRGQGGAWKGRVYPTSEAP